MSNSDASIDPLLRSIASASPFKSCSPIATPENLPSRASEYNSPSPFLQQLNLHQLQTSSLTALESPQDEENLDDTFNDPKRSRACEACRGLKVRCDPDLSNPDAPCKRCAKANRNCIVTAPSRKRRKKTDSRVAELEKKIDALTATLAAQRTGSHSHANQNGENQHTHEHFSTPASPQLNLRQQQIISGQYGSPYACKPEFYAEEAARNNLLVAYQNIPQPTVDRKRKVAEMYANQPDSPTPASSIPANRDGLTDPWPDRNLMGPPNYKYKDVIDRGLITLDLANKIFDCYIYKMAPQMPIVVFPPGTTSERVRMSTPILFLAILSASSGLIYPRVQQALTKEIMSIFAERIIFQGEKSLELIQALQVSTLWYWPSEKYEELKFYQLIHIAAVMAIDIGMGKINKALATDETGLTREQLHNQKPKPFAETLEARRAWLGCYWLCCSASTTLRRPNIICWSSFIADSIDILENSSDAYLSDKILCQFIKAQHIVEEVSIDFSTDNLEESAHLSESEVQQLLKRFERDLKKWILESKKITMTPILKLTEHVVDLYVHEVALQFDRTIEQLKINRNKEACEKLSGKRYKTSLDFTRIDTFSDCLKSIERILEIFISLDTETIRALPVAKLVQVAYAITVLIKVYFVHTSSKSTSGNSISQNDFMIERYINELIDVLRAASVENKSQSSAKFLAALVILKTWFHHQKEKINQQLSLQSDRKQPSPLDGHLKNSTDKLLRTRRSTSLKQPSYSTANTPLHLLSEVAASNSGEQSSSINVRKYPAPANGRQQLPQESFSGFNELTNPAYPSSSLLSRNIDPSLSLEQNNFSSRDGIDNYGPYFGNDALFGGLMKYLV
ncbi:Bgt-2856 [Blumeria graminis f. sp. tritici]|uniref:Bgt-2856 n=2 Tax=Blumeria graminis f. sp. tritici TaxID=62690 RepID=A0A381L2I9_BLUGR|nr:Homodimeric Zn2Cys6 zinc finger transcription factor [Blumeria graminis f. sp. tritici 96224]VDB86374.1 Bgt-2856 [Blumeria graminis f. sp. tritici]